jgi:hypothetical protein
MRSFFASFVLLIGCTSSHGRDARDAGSDVEVDVGVPSFDAGMPRFDAGGPILVPDAGPVDLALGRALTCALDPDAALRAVVRHVACDPAAEGATVVALVEAWEAGLLSQLEMSGGLVEGLGAVYGCDLWRCASDAADCADYAACVEGGRIAGACEPSTTRCEGASMVRCDLDGAASRVLLDCASFGAGCADGRCALGECAFGGDYYDLECRDGALTLCDGAIRMDCGAWIAGASCESFRISGEVPTQWCSTTGMSAYGAYARPVVCDGSTLSFESVSTRVYTLDCAAHGYGACEERGCVP